MIQPASVTVEPSRDFVAIGQNHVARRRSGLGLSYEWHAYSPRSTRRTGNADSWSDFRTRLTTAKYEMASLVAMRPNRSSGGADTNRLPVTI